MNKEQIKALLPDNVEYMIIGKNDYDRLCGELTYKNIKYKEVLDKIKEIFKDYGDKEDIVGYSMYNITGEEVYIILELLEEIE